MFTPLLTRFQESCILESYVLELFILGYRYSGFVDGIHHAGVVGADEIGGDDAARGAVDGIAEHLTVAIDDALLAREELVLGMDMIGVRQRRSGTKFAIEVLALNTKAQLVSPVGIVAHTIVDIVVRDAGACTEGYLTTEIGEEVEPVVVVMFNDGEIAMEHHPVDEVRELAQAAPNALRGLSLGNGESLFIAFLGCGAPNLTPHGEGLTRADDESVDMLDSQGEVGGLVFLQLHIDIAQATTDEGVVAIDDHGERIGGALMGEGDMGEEILEVALQDLLLHG